MSTIINLGKIRFQFRGDYSASQQYEYNDVVRFGGDVYVYINSTAGRLARILRRPVIGHAWSAA